MKRDNKLYVPADKTTKFYKLTQENYNDLLKKNITKEYKKTDESAVKNVNKGDKSIAEKLDLDDRIYALRKHEAFITIKDHKEHFETNTKCRLINPTKSEVGKVSKKILARIVASVKEKTNLKL